MLPEAQKRGIAVLGMKSMGGSGEIVIRRASRRKKRLRYAMSLPVATTISGMDSMDVLEQNLAIAGGLGPMSAGEMQTLRREGEVLGGGWALRALQDYEHV